MNLDELMNLTIADGVTVGDILTVDFLASVLGNVLAAVLILAVGFIIGGWASRRTRWRYQWACRTTLRLRSTRARPTFASAPRSSARGL